MIRKNRKGATGATLVWIVAVFIVLFILVLFIVAVLALSLTKGRIELVGREESESDFIVVTNLIGFLKTEISEGIMQDLILESLDYSLGDERVMLLVRGNINNLEKVGYPPPDFYVENPEAKEMDRKVRNEAKKILDPLCDEYFLKIPQGIISSKGPGFYVGGMNEGSLTSWAEVKVPYKGQIVEIKYRQLMEC